MDSNKASTSGTSGPKRRSSSNKIKYTDKQLMQLLENSDFEDSDLDISSDSGEEYFPDSENDSNHSGEENNLAPCQEIPNDETNTLNTDWIEVDVSKLNKFSFTGKEEYKYNSSYPTDRTQLQPIDVYNQFLNTDILNLIVTETNRNANQFLEQNKKLSRAARAKMWKNTDVEEIKKFFGLLLYMGLVPYPTIADYWSTHVLYKNNFIPNIMSRNRFQLLLRFIHFENNVGADKSDRIYKIRRIIDMLQDQFSAEYVPGETLAIDESMIPFRGRLLLLQYIPNKSHKYGVKIFKLCNPIGYTLQYAVYTGKTDSVKCSLAEKVVTELADNYLDEGRSIVTDNFYTSVPLAQTLLGRKTHSLGTLRKNRKYLPKNVMNRKLNKGEVVGMQHSTGIVVGKWHDKRDVCFLSTKQGINMVPTNKKNRKGVECIKPEAIMEYNKGKQGIDISDQLGSYFTPLRKTLRWYHKVVFEFLLNTSIVNANILHSKLSGSKLPVKQFRESIIIALLGLQAKEPNPAISPPTRPSITSIRHKFSSTDQIDKRNRKFRKKCALCYKTTVLTHGRAYAQTNVKKVNTLCVMCKIPLCRPCFDEKHIGLK